MGSIHERQGAVAPELDGVWVIDTGRVYVDNDPPVKEGVYEGLVGEPFNRMLAARDAEAAESPEVKDRVGGMAQEIIDEANEAARALGSLPFRQQ